MAVSRWQKGDLLVGKTKRGKDTKIREIAGNSGIPVAAYTKSASPHEVKLVEHTIDSGFIWYAPEHLIDDKAYDSNGLDL